MAIIKIVRKITYEVDEQHLGKLRKQMHLSMPVGEAVQGTPIERWGEGQRGYDRVHITIEHLEGPRWPSDAKHNDPLAEEDVHGCEFIPPPRGVLRRPVHSADVVTQSEDKTAAYGRDTPESE